MVRIWTGLFAASNRHHLSGKAGYLLISRPRPRPTGSRYFSFNRSLYLCHGSSAAPLTFSNLGLSHWVQTEPHAQNESNLNRVEGVAGSPALPALPRQPTLPGIALAQRTTVTSCLSPSSLRLVRRDAELSGWAGSCPAFTTLGSMDWRMLSSDRQERRVGGISRSRDWCPVKHLQKELNKGQAFLNKI